MKLIITSFFIIAITFLSFGQCSSVALQITSSDTSYVQLYSAGIFLIPSGDDNICQWEVTTFAGEVIHQATTSGGFNDQSFSLFMHEVAIQDSMKASIIIANNTEGITCAISDTLYWKETEVLPGSFVGNWSVLSSNGGVEQSFVATSDWVTNAPSINIVPSPVLDHFEIDSKNDIHTIVIFNTSGHIMSSISSKVPIRQLDIGHYPTGVYFMKLWDIDLQLFAVKKIHKL